MNLLVDTHLILWASIAPGKLSAKGKAVMADVENSLWFSAVSIWEVAIKFSLKRDGFLIDPKPLRAGLIRMGYIELPVESRHVLDVASMPFWHYDPFDRLLIAQAASEGMKLLTSDATLANYGPTVMPV